MLITDKVQWSKAAEIVVVGLGAAGAVSAITAHDLRAEVLILEKQPAHNHISTSHMTAGAFPSPTDVPGAITYWEHLARVNGGRYWTDRDTIRVVAEYLCQNKEWIEKLGGKPEVRAGPHGTVGGEFDIPGRQSWTGCTMPGLGPGFMRLLKQQVESRGIQVLYDTAADRLLTNVRGEVIGVRVQSVGKEANIKASKAVIMTTGGFEFNEEMKLTYLKVYPTYFAGSPANTGDGIRMAQEVGASLWHMNCCVCSCVLKFPDFPIGFGPNFRGTKGGMAEHYRAAITGDPCGCIIVDKHGRRYTNEEFKRHVVYYELALYDSSSLEYPRVPSYWIFDRKRIEAGPLPMMWYGPMLYRQAFSCHWSKDNSEEIRKGWIIQGRNVEELARKLKMTSSVLEKSVQNYNAYCEQKEDPEFHRPPQHLVPLSEPPFFAVELWPGSAATLGGPRRNKKGQILDTDGKPIPRLYSAGELGSFWAFGGGELGECIASGRIAGENAIKEAPTS